MRLQRLGHVLLAAAMLIAGMGAAAQSATQSGPKGLNALAEESSAPRSARKGGFIGDFCDAGRTAQWVVAAQADGVAQPVDLIAALQTVWCHADRPKDQRLALLSPRLQSRALRAALLADNTEQTMTFWYGPLYLLAQVHSRGTGIDISTTREGGGDTFKWRLVRGVWKLVGFEYGGAC